MQKIGNTSTVVQMKLQDRKSEKSHLYIELCYTPYNDQPHHVDSDVAHGVIMLDLLILCLDYVFRLPIAGRLLIRRVHIMLAHSSQFCSPDRMLLHTIAKCIVSYYAM